MASTEANQGSPIPSLRLPDIVTSPPPHVSSSDAAVTAGPCDVTQPGASRAKPMRTKRRVMGDRTCLVCGDIAIAHNFGALTCETCKAFFRRNASKAQEIPPCQFSKNCVITRSTRRFCAACRMDKCFAVGMDQGLILDDKEKKALQARRREKQREQHEEGSMQMDVSKPAISVPQVSPSGSWHQVVSSHTPASTASGEKRRCDGVLASTFAAPGGLASDSKTSLASMQTFKDAAANSPSNRDPEQSGSTKEM
ncbi:uncharacterized protein LOC143301582 [Babylonia areolata]|uniref:uncharacterized protein LOC143301582 n=1 Tax=Babylonia areolata TaxID=304850 RepID=UPI003FD5073D